MAYTRKVNELDSSQSRLLRLAGSCMWERNMKEIELTQDKVARVDDADFEELNKHKWRAMWDGNTWYARRHSPRDINGKRHIIYMHRQIMGAQSGQEVDHRDRDGLNNRRRGPDGNLRLCTRGQNNANAKKRAGCSSQYKGVTWYKQADKWMAYIKTYGKQIHLGYFDDEIEAALAYNEAAIEHFGEFAHLNTCRR